MLIRKLLAELLGTFWLTFGGCGSAVLAAKVLITEGSSPINIGISLVGVSLAFGLTVLSMAYTIGHISGCHLNPAVSIGLCVGRRVPGCRGGAVHHRAGVGRLAGAAVLFVIASGQANFKIDPNAAGAFATNGFDTRSPGGYAMLSCLIAEVVLTFFFLLIILGATDKRDSSRLCTYRNRPEPDVNSSDWHPGHQPVRQPSSQHRPSLVCGLGCDSATLALLGRTDCRGRRSGNRLPNSGRR